MKKQKNEEDIKKNQVTEKEEETQVEKPDKELEETKKQVEEFKNMYLRALADYKNLENRVQGEREHMRETIKKQVIEEFLPIADHLDQAEIFTTDPGLQMVNNSFRQVLKGLGVIEIELLGNEYDPHTAEAVEAVEGKLDDIIVEVLQKAYAMNGQVIRPGRVKVSKSAK